MKTTVYSIELCGEFEKGTADAYVERLDGYDDPQATEADELFWTLYKREENGLTYAVEDFKTQKEAQAALFDALEDGPQLSDPLGDTPISTTDFFNSYFQKYH